MEEEQAAEAGSAMGSFVDLQNLYEMIPFGIACALVGFGVSFLLPKKRPRRNQMEGSDDEPRQMRGPRREQMKGSGDEPRPPRGGGRGGRAQGAGDEHKQPRAKINLVHSKKEENVIHTLDIENLGEKTAYCRCWRSKKFPLCDGSHADHNKASGDNIGPLVIQKGDGESSRL